jgi:hypothetical protein
MRTQMECACGAAVPPRPFIKRARSARSTFKRRFGAALPQVAVARNRKWENRNQGNRL